MMKSINFLAFLVGTTMFAACSQEELVENNNTPQQMEEVIGAKLVGTDVSLNVTMGETSSRWAGGEMQWDDSDVVGMGWILSKDTEVSDDQNATVDPVSSKLYANHMFNYERKSKSWATKGNLYEGWHFAYYPWNYEKKAGQNKFYELNPAVKSGESATHVSQSLHLSNRQFIVENDVDKVDNKLTKPFKLYQAVKFIKITTQAAENSPFVKEGDFEDFLIKSITVNAGKDIFAENVVIAAANLPINKDYNEDTENSVVDKENEDAFCKAYSNVVKIPSGKQAVSEISRNLEAAGFMVSTNGSWYMNVLPNTADLDINEITVTIETNRGSFVISQKNAGLSAINKKAFEDLKAAYATNGVLTNLYNEDGKNLTLKLTLELRTEDFKTEFLIEDYDNWTSCVEDANTLGANSEMPVFFLADGAEITFDADHPMIAPNVDFKLVSKGKSTIIIDDEEVEWPTNIYEGRFENITVAVNKDKSLLVNSIMRGTLINDGTIIAGENAVTGRGLTNNSVVEVAIGTKIDKNATKIGKISYIVPQDYDLAAIQELFGTNNANVNTLVIGENLTFECVSPFELTDINLEINGGTVKTSNGYSVTAKDVTMNGGTIANVNVENLNVNSAENNVSNLNVNSNVTVAATANLDMENVTIQGKLTNEGNSEINAELCTTVGEITNNGELKANTDVYVKTIVLGDNSKTTVATGKTIWYSNNTPEFMQNGTTSGAIRYYDANSKFITDLSAAENGDVVVMMKDERLDDLSLIPEGVIIKGANKDYKLNLDLSSVMKIEKDVTFENLTIVGQTSNTELGNYASMLLFTGNVTFKNVVFENAVAVADDARFESCTFSLNNNFSYSLWIANYGKTVYVTDCTFNAQRGIKILEDFNIYFKLNENYSAPTLYISGTDFDINYDTVVMAGYDSTINWGENNSYSASITYPVFVRNELWNLSSEGPNYKGVIVNGCDLWYEK